MKKAEIVHKILGSLNSKENKAVKSAIGNSMEKDYQKLYHLLNNSKTFNRKKLEKRFADNAKLAANTSYLFEKIIESQRTVKSSDLFTQLLRGVEEYKLLYRKDIPELAQKIAEKTYAKAIEFEFWGLAKDIIIELDRYNHIEYHLLEELLPRINNIEQNYLKIYLKFYIPIMKLVEKSHPLRETKDIKEMKAFLESPYLQNPENVLSHRAEMLRLSSLLYGNISIANIEKAVEYNRMAVDLFNKNPKLKAVYWNAYLAFKGNLIQHIYDLGAAYEQEIETLAQEFKKEVALKDGYESFYGFILGVMPSFYLSKSLNIEKAIEWQTKNEIIFNKIKTKSSEAEKTIYHMNSVSIYYKLGNYQQALEHALLIKHTDKEVRDDIYLSAKIWYLIINFELKNWKHLIAESWTNYYRIKKKQPEAEAEKKCALFFKKAAEKMMNNEINATIECIKKLRSELIKLSNLESEKIFIQEIEILDWLDKKETDLIKII